MEQIGKVLNRMELVTPTREGSELSKPSKPQDLVVADWLTLYMQMYPQQEMTPELAIAYKQGLKHLDPELLHLAFQRAMRDSGSSRRGFRPTVGEICEAADKERETLTPKKSRVKQDCEQCGGTGYCQMPSGTAYTACSCWNS